MLLIKSNQSNQSEIKSEIKNPKKSDKPPIRTILLEKLFRNSDLSKILKNKPNLTTGQKRI